MFARLIIPGALFCCMLSLAPAPSVAQSTSPFVPADFRVPERLETREFRLRMLTVNDVVKDYDAVVYLWARQSELPGGMEHRLHAAVKDWIAKEWPLKKVAFPRRDVDRETWNAIPEEKR